METQSKNRYSGLNKMIDSFSLYKNLIGAAELNNSIPTDNILLEKAQAQTFSNAVLMLWTLEGSAQINLDYSSYTLDPDNFIIVLPIHIFSITQISPDFKGRVLMVHRSFLDECNVVNSNLSTANYMSLRQRPYISFNPGETIYLNKCFDELKQKIEQESHAFHKEVIYNSFSAFLLEMAHLMNEKKKSKTLPILSRKEEIVNRFFQLLLVNCRVQHTTTFYADKLCITSQYLSFILKDVTGKPANHWISEALIAEAKIQLRKPQTTIQEVAYSLNFSDQSSFGKFFKKGSGISPTQYKTWEGMNAC